MVIDGPARQDDSLVMTLRATCLIVLMCVGTARAAEWSWQWPAKPGDATPTVTVSPFKYGKDWAYSVEIDDGPITTLTVVQPLLAKFNYTDAPPGVAGGKPRPLVGGAALIVGSTGTGNNTLLQWDDVRKLQSLGWGAINHSYYHAGHTWGNPPENLTDAQFRTDLFWSQMILAAEVGNGRAPSHLVYPNGYTDYATHMKEFGLHSGSLVGRPVESDVYSAKFDPLQTGRAYLDNGAWEAGGKGDPMTGFPKDGPPKGVLHIDFTHGIEADTNSANYKRWTERLTTIATRYGTHGADNLWCAPSNEVFDYVAAAKVARFAAASGKITVLLPDDVAGAALTLKIDGIPASAKLIAPDGGAVYRQGNTVWVTSPIIGHPGSPPPYPRVKRVYDGPAKDVTFDHETAVAGVRLSQDSPSETGVTLEAITPGGNVSIAADHPSLEKVWHRWLLFSVVPNKPSVKATGVHVGENKVLSRMEVWAEE